MSMLAGEPCCLPPTYETHARAVQCQVHVWQSGHVPGKLCIKLSRRRSLNPSGTYRSPFSPPSTRMSFKSVATLAVAAAAVVSVVSAQNATANSVKEIAIGNIVGEWKLASSFVAPAEAPAGAEAAAANPNDCPESIKHEEFTELVEIKQEKVKIYSVDFDRIVVDGEECSDRSPITDRLVVIPSLPSITSITEIPVIKSLDIATLFSGRGAGASAAGKEAQTALDGILNSVASFLVGVDLGDRSCGDNFETPANTPYLFISPEKDIVINPTNDVVIKAGVDNMVSVNNQALCVYSRKRTVDVDPVKDTIDKIKDAAECFPAAAKVTLASGATRRMAEVRIGDVVAVGRGEFSPVFAFTHADSSAKTSFVRLETCCGEVLLLTPGHYIYANGALVAAGSVRVGDEVMGASGMVKKIVAVGSEEGAGIYNPQTLHGSIVVDGIVASTYTTAVEAGIAHGLLAPVRKAFEWSGFGPSLASGADMFAGLVGGPAITSK